MTRSPGWFLHWIESYFKQQDSCVHWGKYLSGRCQEPCIDKSSLFAMFIMLCGVSPSVVLIDYEMPPPQKNLFIQSVVKHLATIDSKCVGFRIRDSQWNTEAGPGWAFSLSFFCSETKSSPVDLSGLTSSTTGAASPCLCTHWKRILVQVLGSGIWSRGISFFWTLKNLNKDKTLYLLQICSTM